MSASTVSFANGLGFSVTVYDSFSTQDTSNYFGALTPLATVPANTTVSVPLIHPTSVLIISNATTNSPLARLIYLPMLSATAEPLGVGQADANAMAQTMEFITFITNSQKDPLTQAFLAILKDSSKPQVTLVNQFFAQHPVYASCTFATYMMGIAYTAEQPVSKGKTMNQALYSLSTLITSLGGTWPSDLPDIVVTKFTCDTQNDVLAIKAEIDLNELPAQSDQELQYFGSLFDVQQLKVAISFNYSFGINMLGTRLSISLDAMNVPFGSSETLTINKPTATIDIMPLCKFVVFTVTGSIPFNVFGKAFETDVSMVLDNIEANFGVIIKGDSSSLPAPPLMQGVHFDAFGVGIGIIFEPPSAAIGLYGQLHIGDPGSNTQVTLDDDKYVVVCQMVEDVPNPLYISFYVPQMHLTDVLIIFTNTQCPLDVPVSFNDLSFKWTENPLHPVALPDGSLSSMGYGFSAAADILGFSFYGDMKVDLNNGLTADIEMSPMTLGSVFTLGGDGTGVSIKVDASGNPIKNNQLVTKAAQQQALKGAMTKQLVPPGGPVLRIRTSASPYLHLNVFVDLFEAEKVQLTADVTSSGIKFEVNFDGVLTSNMSCTLADFHNLAATFQFGINDTISLPSVGGVSLGSIPLEALVNAHFSLSTNTSDIVLKVGGGFDFEGLMRNFGDFTIDAHIQKVSDLLSSIVSYIEDNADVMFKDLLGTAEVWAGKVQQGVITAVKSVATVLSQAFNQDAGEVASTMKGAGFSLEGTAKELSQIFDPGQVAGAFKSAFDLSPIDVARVMQQGGFPGESVAGALRTAYGDSAIMPIASALQNVYNWNPDRVQGVLDALGFPADQIGQVFPSINGPVAQAGNDISKFFDPFNIDL